MEAPKPFEETVDEQQNGDGRIARYQRAVQRMARGDLNVEFPVTQDDEIGELGESLVELNVVFKRLFAMTEELFELVGKISAGNSLEEVLDFVYDEFHCFVPYDRIGFAVIEQDGAVVRSLWNRSDAEQHRIKSGYRAPLRNSSLQQIIETGQPRIINDLKAYLKQNPDSHSTRLILQEGMRSSLTCPLLADGRAVGFMFFSSKSRGTYRNAHVETFLLIAGHLSIILEKARLFEQIEDCRCESELFARLVCEDLMPPISVIAAHARSIDGNTQDQQVTGTPSGILQVCTDLFAKLNSFAVLGHPLTGKLTINPRPTDIMELVNLAVEQRRDAAALKRVRFEVARSTNLSPISVEPEYVQFAIEHLLARAAEYAPADSTVQIGAHLTGGWLRVTIRVPGTGLPEDAIEAARKFPHRPAQLGRCAHPVLAFALAVIRRLAARHEGKLTVEREQDEQRLILALPLVGPRD